jgi:hypothetical protein
MTRRRRVGDPWYTALYQEPARLWWLVPLAGAASWFVLSWVRIDLAAAVAGASGWLLVTVPLYGWRWRRDKRRTERDAPTD